MRSTSVSQIDNFIRCELRWLYKSVLKRPEPERAFNELGTRTHKQLKHYLATGEDVMNEIARAGKHLLPPVGGAELKLEWGLNDKPQPERNGKALNFFPDEEGGAKSSLVWAAGVPLIGFMDVVDPRPLHILSDGSAIHEPTVVESLDHKTTKDFKWAKAESELLHTPQMCGYGRFVVKKYPWATAVRLSHIAYRTEGAPKAEKATVLVTAAEVNQKWEQTFEPIVERMKVVETKTEAEVEGNLSACDDYGGCAHRGYCPTFKSQNAITRMKAMGLLSNRKTATPANGAAVAAPPAGNTPWIQPPPGAVVAPPPPQAAPPPPAAAKSPFPITDVIPASKAQQGQKYLVRNVLTLFLCSHNGKQTFAPLGGGMPIGVDDGELVTVAPADAVPAAAPPVQAPPAPAAATFLPPPVAAPPPPAPVAPVPILAAPPAVAPPPPPPAPVAVAPPAPPPPPAAAPTEAPKRGRGRPTKAEQAAKAAAAGGQVVAAAQAAQGITLFVNAVPNGPFTDLSGYVYEATAQLEEQFDVPDIRAASADNNLSFNRWRGALAAMVKAEPPPPGVYVAFTKGDEFTEVVAAAVASLCAPGQFVRGV